ncbi:hypothetical protein PENSPDRAFT_759306 [Peniophora sp. CONT]|nr:hypothetical protein PENSPDRAFT_759306 [Peniophora sp. CONT]
MPALALRQSTSPASALAPWVLNIIITILVLVFVMASIVFGSCALSRRRTCSGRAPVNSISASWRRRSSGPKLKPLLLGSSLSQPMNARLRPTVNKEFTLVRGARLSRSLSSYSSSGVPVLPPLAIYTPGLHTPAPARRFSDCMATPPASTGLDTPPPTPIIAPPVRVEDLIRQRAEASREYALPSSDSTASSLFSYSSSSSGSSLTDLLGLFPTPPTSGREVKLTRPVENLYPTPPPSPLVPVVEFHMPTMSNDIIMPTPTPLQPTALSHSISPSNSDILLLDRLFASGHPSSPHIPEMASFKKPECPPLQVFTAYKAPIAKFSPMPAYTSFCASFEDDAENGYLTPPASPLWS